MNPSTTLPSHGAEKPKRVKLGAVELASRFLLAPLAGYTNLAFRTAVRGLGGLGLATTDLVNARALLRASGKTIDLIRTNKSDRPLAVQIYGAIKEELADAARWLENYGVTSVDINMGCPVRKVTRGGGGSALLCEGSNAVDLVRAVVEAVRIPVTVKMRLGWDNENLSGPWFAGEFEKAGVAGITIHGRTREQGFSGLVNLEGIRAVVQSVERIPIFGNGDVRNIAEAQKMFEVTGCAGIAIGRGALLNPWIFSNLARWDEGSSPLPPPSLISRLDFMRKHFNLLLEYKGEHFACLSFRKVANWYCKVLKPGREIQARIMRVDSQAEFDCIAAEMEKLIQARQDAGWEEPDFSIQVPAGPNAHW